MKFESKRNSTVPKKVAYFATSTSEFRIYKWHLVSNNDQKMHEFKAAYTYDEPVGDENVLVRTFIFMSSPVRTT